MQSQESIDSWKAMNNYRNQIYNYVNREVKGFLNIRHLILTLKS